MKFAVVLAAIFVCAQSSAVLPYSAWPYAAGAWNGWNAWNGAHAWAPSAPITQYSSYPAAHVVYGAYAPAAVSYAAHVAAPSAYVAHAAPAVYAAPHSASYTAANRGSVHTAPLPGHAVSQTSLNLAPAPGTH